MFCRILRQRISMRAHQIAEGIWRVIENHGQVRREVLDGRPGCSHCQSGCGDGD